MLPEPIAKLPAVAGVHLPWAVSLLKVPGGQGVQVREPALE